MAEADQVSGRVLSRKEQVFFMRHRAFTSKVGSRKFTP